MAGLDPMAAIVLLAWTAGEARAAPPSQSAPTGNPSTTAAARRDTAIRPLLGSWRLTADDDQPKKKPAPEVITFNRDGTWRVTEIPEPFGGRYRVEDDEVVMTTVAEGNTRVLRRRFRVDGQGLHFANIKEGFAHYVRVAPPK